MVISYIYSIIWRTKSVFYEHQHTAAMTENPRVATASISCRRKERREGMGRQGHKAAGTVTPTFCK
jgi:hypothetical protein